MASGDAGAVLRDVGAVYSGETVAGLSDAQLLARFAAHRDRSAEAAFEALVERHGPMVLGVCRGVLRDPHDADDAFQATFLVLMRHAGRTWTGASVASWLYAVAQRVAVKARAQARRHRERAQTRPVAEPSYTRDDDDTAAVLHQEISRLPEPQRAAVVLCYLQGRTHDEAALALRWPVGTVRSRLARARDRLRDRLIRRGFAPAAAGALAATAPDCAQAAVASSLRKATVQAAMTCAARGSIAAGTVSAGVAILTEGVLRSMFLYKLRRAAAVCLAAGLAVGGTGVAARHAQERGDAQADAAAKTPEDPQPPPERRSQERRAVSAVQQLAAAEPAAGARGAGLGGQQALTPRELEIRLKSARQKIARINPLRKKGYATDQSVDAAQDEFNVLVAQVQSQIEDLEDEIELLEVRVQVKKANVDGATARCDREKASFAGVRSLIAKNAGSVSQAEVDQQRGNVAAAEAELKGKQAELTEVEVRLKQAKRRLGRFKAIDTSHPADTPAELAPAAKPAKP